MYLYSKTYGYKKAYFDKCDYDKIINYRWLLKKDRNTYYLHSAIKGKKKMITIHRLIMDVNNPEEFIDHIDRNGLNNRRDNLRIVDDSLNCKNRNSSKLLPGLYVYDDYIIIHWNVNCERQSKYYSIKKLGYQKALKKAIRKLVTEKIKNGYIIDNQLKQYYTRYVKIKKNK